MTKTYEIRITVTVDNEGTKMKIDSASNLLAPSSHEFGAQFLL